MARLDRLAPVREVAQIGAVVGREFSFELLSAVAGMPKERLSDALAQLVQSELIFQRGEIPQAVYTFKHALVRDAAYAGLLKTRRAQLHAAIAVVIEERFPEIVDAQPETLAHHLTVAGLNERAAHYWLKAGMSAARRSANPEAIAHLQRGIEAVRLLPDMPTKLRTELDFQLALGPTVIAAQGPASATAVATFARARELCEALSDVPEYLQVMFWLVTASVIRGELLQAHEAITALLRLAEARGDRPALLNAMRGEAMILLFMGRLVDAREALERAVGAFSASTDAERMAARAAGQDAGVANLALMSWTLWALGQVDEAVTRINAALQRAEAVEHPHSQAYATYYAAVLLALRGEPGLAKQYAERCVALSEEHGFGQWRGLSGAVRGICSALLDDAATTLPAVVSALEDYRRAGYQLGITALYVLLCPVLLNSGQQDSALDLIEQGIAIANQNSERIFEAELYRLKGRALMVRNSPEAAAEAETLLRKARSTAKAQHARTLELRAAMDLASLWINQNRRQEARDLVTPIYLSFSEGYETGDLVAARSLLELDR
jgi:tetratricopeptide (TPR) repeat protein